MLFSERSLLYANQEGIGSIPWSASVPAASQGGHSVRKYGLIASLFATGPDDNACHARSLGGFDPVNCILDDHACRRVGFDGGSTAQK